MVPRIEEHSPLDSGDTGIKRRPQHNPTVSIYGNGVARRFILASFFLKKGPVGFALKIQRSYWKQLAMHLMFKWVFKDLLTPERH